MSEYKAVALSVQFNGETGKMSWEGGCPKAGFFAENPPRAWGTLHDSELKAPVSASRAQAYWRNEREDLFNEPAELHLLPKDPVQVPLSIVNDRMTINWSLNGDPASAGVEVTPPEKHAERWPEIPVTLRRGKVWFTGFVPREALILPDGINLTLDLPGSEEAFEAKKQEDRGPCEYPECSETKEETEAMTTQTIETTPKTTQNQPAATSPTTTATPVVGEAYQIETAEKVTVEELAAIPVIAPKPSPPNPPKKKAKTKTKPKAKGKAGKKPPKKASNQGGRVKGSKNKITILREEIAGLQTRWEALESDLQAGNTPNGFDAQGTMTALSRWISEKETELEALLDARTQRRG